MNTHAYGEAADAKPPHPRGDAYAELIRCSIGAAPIPADRSCPGGQTDRVPAAHHPVAAAMHVLIVKLGKKTTRFVLAVLPGDARIDVSRVKELKRATYAGFAATDVAERLAGTVAGTVLPFTFHPDLELIVDASLLEHETIYFNAARLDRSIALRTSDYVAIASPKVEAIVVATAP